MIEWKEQKFNELNTKELYEIFKLRCEVFVVEQEILYNDFDDKDYNAIHLSGFKAVMFLWCGCFFIIIHCTVGNSVLHISFFSKLKSKI